MESVNQPLYHILKTQLLFHDVILALILVLSRRDKSMALTHWLGDLYCGVPRH